MLTSFNASVVAYEDAKATSSASSDAVAIVRISRLRIVGLGENSTCKNQLFECVDEESRMVDNVCPDDDGRFSEATEYFAPESVFFVLETVFNQALAQLFRIKWTIGRFAHLEDEPHLVGHELFHRKNPFLATEKHI